MARRKVNVGAINNVIGGVNIAAGNIINNINTIYERALTAAEEAAQARKLESELLARGVAMLAQSLSAQANEGTQSESPYKGLIPYSLNEAEIFYGRNRAQKDLLNRIKQSSLTVLHAESGAGKTSLLQAGIAAQLMANGHLAVHLRPHNTDPVEFIKRMFLPELNQAHALAGASLHEFLRQVCAVLGPKANLHLLLDQFEDFFSLLKKEERQPFLKSMADCLNDPSLKVRWVLALRAEALSDLHELETFGIAPFKSTYRLNRLSRLEAKEVMIEPSRRYNIVFEQALIDHILDTLTSNDEVRPTHLQLVCSALTDDLLENKTLTLAYYTEHEGGTEGILRDYLKRQLENLPAGERALAWKVLRALITADRQRVLKTHDEIIQKLKTSGVSKKQIETVLRRLVERRLLFIQNQPATEETFELAHDYLIKEIELDPQEQGLKAAQEMLDQETRTYQRHKTLLTAERLAVIQPYQNELHFSADAMALLSKSRKAIRQERRFREQRRNIMLVISFLIAIAMSLLAFWGFGRSEEATEQAATAQANAKEAQKQARISRAGELAAQSVALRNRNFSVSMLLGIESFIAQETVQSRGTLMDNAYENPRLQTYLSGHTDHVFSIAFSPDGKILASGSYDHTVRLWNVHTKQPIGQPLRGHNRIIQSVTFSPDGNVLASGSRDGTIILWDIATRQPIGQPLRGHTAWVWTVAFSPDGKTLASGSIDNTIILWDVPTQQPIGQPLSNDTTDVFSVVFSPDGKTLAAGKGRGTIVLWDVATRQLIAELPRRHTGSVDSVAFSPDGKMLVSGSYDSTIVMWDVATSQPIGQPLTGHSSTVFDVGFSPDGKMLASGSGDDTIILWEVGTRQPIGEPLRGHTGAVLAVSFSPNGNTLASGSGDRTIILWELATRQPVGVPLMGHTDTVFTIAFSPDGKVLASGSEDGTIILWDTIARQPIGEPLRGHTGSVKSIAFSPDGKALASGSADKTIILWDIVTRQPVIGPLNGHTDSVNSVAFSPDGKVLASGSEDGTIILWDVQDKRSIGEPLVGHTDSVNSIAFSPDSKTLASGSGDGTIALWDLTTRQLSGHPLRGNSTWVSSIAFSPDGKLLASGSSDYSINTIILWDITTRRPTGQLLIGHTWSVSSVTFSPDGQTLASGSADGTIILWDMESHQAIGEPLDGDTNRVNTVAFRSDGKVLASGSWDNNIVLWDMDPLSWIQKTCQRAGRNFTQGEWEQYFPDEEYRATCPQWPLEP